MELTPQKQSTPSGRPRPNRRWPRLRRPTRRGSVLVLVVGLLVLMAIVGTAYISTARSDRYSARQNTENTQIDLLVDGVVNIAKAQIAGDLFDQSTDEQDNGQYRLKQPLDISNGTASGGATYQNRDEPQYDFWLGDRTPEPVFGVGPGLTVNYGWRHLSKPPLGFNLRAPDDATAGFAIGDVAMPRVETAADATDDPALQFNDGKKIIVRAADADGDGIADAALWELPVPRAGNVTFFAAWRILDNSSAINANTALSRDADLEADGTPYDAGDTLPQPQLLGMFPANVGLFEVLGFKPATGVPTAQATQDAAEKQLLELNRYRFGYPDGSTDVPVASTTPVSDQGQAATGVAYLTQGEAITRGLATRLNDPAHNGPAARYRPLAIADAAALAYRFVMINPPATPSAIERALEDSVYTSAPNYAVDPAQRPRQYARKSGETGVAMVARWYKDNFEFHRYANDTKGAVAVADVTDPNTIAMPAFDLAPNSGDPRFQQDSKFMPRRAVLTTFNPLSNAVPAAYVNRAAKTTPNPGMLPYGDRGPWRTNVNYRAGDVVTEGGEAYVLTNAASPGKPSLASTSKWKPLAPRLARVPWNPAQTYNAGDVVAYDPPPASVADPDPNDPTPPGQYVCLANGVSGTFSPANWQRRTIDRTAVKADLNAAPFAELWRAYWNVMCDPENPESVPAKVVLDHGNTSGSERSTAHMMFRSSLRDHRYADTRGTDPFDPRDDVEAEKVTALEVFTARKNAAAASNPPLATPANKPLQVSPPEPVWPVGMARFQPDQQMLLRAALAAVNTIDLRDGTVATGGTARDEVVTSRTIVLQATTEGDALIQPQVAPIVFPVEVTVYGYEPQPFITEVYANTDTREFGQIPVPTGVTPGTADPAAINPNGYVAVELHNPYPFDIPLVNWNLGVIDRRSPLAPPNAGIKALPTRTIQTITGFAGFGGAGTAPIVPAQGYLVLENYDPAAAAPNGMDAGFRPTSSKLAPTGTPATAGPLAVFHYVPNLHEVLENPTVPARTGGELVLLRPRRSDGVLLPPSTAPNDSYDETLIHDLVPVDSHDFTGLFVPQAADDPLTARNETNFRVAHYCRPSLSSPSGVLPVVDNRWRFVYPGPYDMTRDGSYGGTTTWIDGLTDHDNDPATPLEPKSLGDFHYSYDRYAEVVYRGEYTPDKNAPAPEEDQRRYHSGIRGGEWASVGTEAEKTEPTDWYKSGELSDVTPPAAGTPLFVPPTVGLGTGEAVYAFPNLAAQLGPNGDESRLSYSRDFLPTQLNNVDFAGFNAPDGGVEQFPFGGFARDADVLKVPFIGAYRVRALQRDADGNPVVNPGNPTPNLANPAVPGEIVELNAVTIDSAFADDNVRVTEGILKGDMPRGRVNAAETIGHFVSSSPRANPDVQQWSTLGSTGWASDVLDYFTALPVPEAYDPDPGAGRIDAGDERLRATHGLVNINTAPWFVLAQLPLVLDPATGRTDLARNYELAKMIAYRRSDSITNSPYYNSLLDLQKLFAMGGVGGPNPQHDAFSSAMFTLPGDPDDAHGDYSPLGQGQTDGVGPHSVRRSPFGSTGLPPYDEPFELERRYLNLTRLSNLLTVRSDAYTVYLVVEGWSDAYTPDAKRVVQRRVAFLIDRSAVTEFNKKPRIYNIPTQ